MNNKDVQRILRHRGLYSGAIDGILGRISMSAIATLLYQRRAKLPNNYEMWSNERKGIGAAQIILSEDKFYTGTLDGLVGYETTYALEQFNEFLSSGKRPSSWRPDDTFTSTVGKWGSQSDMARRYGPAGGPQCFAGRVQVPFKLKLAWNLDTTISSFSCHEAIARSATAAYEKVANEFSTQQIQELGLNIWGGCYAFRNKRGGSTLSTHAYGLAIDTDPLRNQLRWNATRARLGKSDASKWFDIWESEGWQSLGRYRDFDWMHVQAVKV
jgi:hypothetical protein